MKFFKLVEEVELATRRIEEERLKEGEKYMQIEITTPVPDH